MSAHSLVALFQPRLEPLLTPTRWQHSLGVMRVAGELAQVYGHDQEAAWLAGLLHDAAKDLSPAEQMAWVERGRYKMVDPCEAHPVYLHAPAGAALMEADLAVQDEPALLAVACHSYGGDWAATTDPFALCLRIADVLEPVTPWQGMGKMRRLALAGRLQEATLLHAHWVRELFLERNVPLHPNLLRVEREWAAALCPAPDFFDRD